LKRRDLILQWHLTERCQHACAHCYARDEDAPGAPELDLPACLEVVRQHRALCQRISAVTGIAFRPRFLLSGGDPLLRPGFWQILRAVAQHSDDSMILGNADLLDARVAAELLRLGVRRYQLSLDGLQATHDGIRGAGSFAKTLDGLEVLRRAGIKTHIMSTVWRRNAAELPALIELATERGVDVFSFARAAAVGQARQEDLAMDPFEYRALLLEVHALQTRLQRQGAPARFPRKDHLWTPLLQELGELRIHPHVKPGKTKAGCHMGQSFFVLLADGQAMACRRFPSPVGRFPQQSLEEIFMRSSAMARYRRVGQLQGCAGCELLLHCRGCRAVAHGHCGDWRGVDPQCWRRQDWPPAGPPQPGTQS